MGRAVDDGIGGGTGLSGLALGGVGPGGFPLGGAGGLCGRPSGLALDGTGPGSADLGGAVGGSKGGMSPSGRRPG